MSITFDVAGRVTLNLFGAEAATERRIAQAMDPCRPVEQIDRAAGLTIECGAEVAECHELLNPARDATTTGAAAAAHVLVHSTARITLPRHDRPQATIRISPGGSVTSIVRSVIRPALQVLMLDAEAVAIHAACVEMDGEAVAVAGWSETGKTEVALALMELGGRFVSDKWTVVGDDGSAGTFPIGVGVRRWVLDALPTLRSALPASARIRMGGAAVAGIVTSPLRRLGGGRVGRLVAGQLSRGIAIADRASLTPSEIADAYGHGLDPAATRPLRAVVILSTIPGGEIRVDEVTPEWAARRLARSAQYERRGYFDLLERARYAEGGDATSLRGAVEGREEALLGRVLDGVRLYHLSLPFPSDPRPAAAAIAERVAR